jgi:hypothetical protein
MLLRPGTLGRSLTAARAVHRPIALLMRRMWLRGLPRLWRGPLRRRRLLWCRPLLPLGLAWLPLLRRGLIAPNLLIAPTVIA